MSIEQAKAAIEKMKADKAFLDEVNAKATSEEKLEVINAAGYECSKEELRELIAQQAKEELAHCDHHCESGKCPDQGSAPCNGTYYEPCCYAEVAYI